MAALGRGEVHLDGAAGEEVLDDAQRDVHVALRADREASATASRRRRARRDQLVGGVAAADVERLAGDALGHGVGQARVAAARACPAPAPRTRTTPCRNRGVVITCSASSPVGGLRGLEGHGAGLELGHPGRRVEGGVGQVVDRRAARPVERGEHGVGADVRRQPGARIRASRAGCAATRRSPSATPSRAARSGWISTHRLGLGVEQRLGAPGLRAGLVVRPACGRWSAGTGTRRRAARRRRGGARRGSGPGRPGSGSRRGTGAACPGASSVRAGPEHAALGVDALVADARRSRPSPPALARRSSSKTARGLAVEERAAAQPVGELGEDLEVAAHAVGRRRRRGGAAAPGPRGWSSCPSSSAHWVLGRTTSASSAVSERKRSETHRKSSAPSRSRDVGGARRRRPRCSTP